MKMYLYFVSSFLAGAHVQCTSEWALPYPFSTVAPSAWQRKFTGIDFTCTTLCTYESQCICLSKRDRRGKTLSHRTMREIDQGDARVLSIKIIVI